MPRGAGYRKDVEKINSLLKSSVEGKAEWINLSPLFLNEEDRSIRDDLGNDELHLSGPGYLIWHDVIAEKVS